jgi:small subunit ribosomal protein S21
MLIIPVNNPKEIERALKTLKSKVNKTGLIKDIRDRKEYKKPSVVKREIKKNAIYIQKLRNEEN